MEEANVRRLYEEHGSVEELNIDVRFQQHLLERTTYEKHVVTISEVLEVHASAPRYFLNEGYEPEGERAPVIMVGQTAKGRWLCVPIEPAGTRGVWRPKTAFQANRHHIEKYKGVTE